MGFTSWVDTRIQKAVDHLETDSGPIVRSVVDGVLRGLAQDSTMVVTITEAVVTGVVHAVVGEIQQIPQHITGLIEGELAALPGQVKDVLELPEELAHAVEGAIQNLPQNIKDVLDIPAEVLQAVEQALTTLPQQIEQAIHSIIPFALEEQQRMLAEQQGLAPPTGVKSTPESAPKKKV